MKHDLFQLIKVNATAFAALTLSQLDYLKLAAQIVLILVTIVYTAAKTVAVIRKLRTPKGP